MRFLPVFLDTCAGVVILVGSGEPARGKLRLLRAAGAHVRWFSRDVDVAEEMLTLSGPGRLEISFGDPLKADLADAVAVVSAAGDALDAQIAARARRHRIPVNVVDRPELSTFIFPAVVDRGEVVVAIGTGGASPVLARRLRELIEALLPTRIGELAQLIGRHRRRFAAVPRALSPRRFWENIIAGPIAEAVLAGRSDEAEVRLVAAIDGDGARESSAGKAETVFLVGAGPGDPDLLTLRALHALADADVVFYDELVTPAVLDRARRDAEQVFVGKRRGEAGIGQDEINRRLVAAARAGRRVVRLKGGDPFIFGRGGEELEYLRVAGVPVVVVPGVTAALGCAAEAGLPLTFRNEAGKLAFITAQRAEEAAAIDWSSLTDRQTTLVVYMGLASVAAVRDGLIAAGRDGETPAAVLARGTRPDSQAAVGRLDELAALASEVGEGPAILVIGEVVARSTPWRAAHVEKLIAREAA
ncbi:MAG: siroheme synthase CysG [Hyphomicrobiales bacterium]|jgi:uroporphyrin-III C-methyltransferase/precorrin-2 dehydrogenase/sirohydrochlorin ferrochelatase|nr:siroheme synthase CysG [Xanthobacteraceae bacterium]